MNKPTDWDSVQAAGEFEALELGGHVCKILRADIVTNSTGSQALRLYIDIADGKQAGYFKKQFNNSTFPDKKWPVGGQVRQNTEGKSLGFFKGLITSIEKSNPNYKWAWDETTLKGKLFGGVFGREQYRNQSGELKFSTKCVQVRSAEGIHDVPAPEDKLLKDPMNDLYSKVQSAFTPPASSQFTELDEDGTVLPF